MYRIISFSDLYSGKWLVIRLYDMRLIKSFTSIFEALRWEKIWGPVAFNDRGSELSWRVKERLDT